MTNTTTIQTVGYAGFVGFNIFERSVTKFAPHKALKFIASGKLTLDKKVVLRRVGMRPNGRCSVGGGEAATCLSSSFLPSSLETSHTVNYDPFITRRYPAATIFKRDCILTSAWSGGWRGGRARWQRERYHHQPPPPHLKKSPFRS